MAAINETISGSGEANASAEFTPTNSVSDASVQGGKGTIHLQAKAPGGEWHFVSLQSGVYPVETSDTAWLYRFVPSGVPVPGRHVYLGP